MAELGLDRIRRRPRGDDDGEGRCRNPNAILINPTDWARLQAIRSGATNDGIYYSGGPYGALRERLWGGPTEAQTPRVPESTALVGDFADGATLFRKGGPRLETSNRHDDFSRWAGPFVSSTRVRP